jgi:hypothetical protein
MINILYRIRAFMVFPPEFEVYYVLPRRKPAGGTGIVIRHTALLQAIGSAEVSAEYRQIAAVHIAVRVEITWTGGPGSAIGSAEVSGKCRQIAAVHIAVRVKIGGTSIQLACVGHELIGTDIDIRSGGSIVIVDIEIQQSIQCRCE